ncbi:hypothetical protein AAEP80_14120 [Curtobacterium sp. L3-7]|uniref:hypothetical protein n=1 Tax=Curtobacterium sp. L3-7 TaxID=3138787 RepID=UPI003B518451
MPSRSVNFRGDVPPVAAIRETLTRLNDVITASYKEYTWSMFQAQYDSPASVPDPPVESVYADTTFTMADETGSQSFPTLSSFLAYIETHDYKSAYAHTRSSAPGEMSSGFTLNMRPFASFDDHGSVEVHVSNSDALGGILAPVQVEVRRIVRESEERTLQTLQDSIDAMNRDDDTRRKRHSIPKGAWGWIGSVIAGLIVAALAKWFGWV